METGLIAVRIYDDGRQDKALSALWEEIFGVKGAVLTGDVFERAGVKWFTPGNGCQSFTPDVRAKIIAALKERKVDAEDWTAGGEWKQGDDYQKNDAALKAAVLEPKGLIVATQDKAGRVTTAVVMTASPTK